jgi:hypothetical protein
MIKEEAPEGVAEAPEEAQAEKPAEEAPEIPTEEPEPNGTGRQKKVKAA